MFPGQDNPEAFRIGIIAIIFGISFVLKSMYEWTMFILLRNQHTNALRTMIQI